MNTFFDSLVSRFVTRHANLDSDEDVILHNERIVEPSLEKLVQPRVEFIAAINVVFAVIIIVTLAGLVL
jgi:hypothetical protein